MTQAPAADSKMEDCPPEPVEPASPTWHRSEAASPRVAISHVAVDEILNNIEIGILVLDLAKETIGFRNPASFEILGDRTDPLDYRSVDSLFQPGDEGIMAPAVSKTLQYGNRLIGYSIYQTSEQYRCLFLRNITEKARLESIAQAVNNMDNIGFIFSGIRHEIGNPLNSIKVTLTVLRQNLADFTKERLEEYINRSLGEIGRLEFLLKSLRNFSMFENVSGEVVNLQDFLATFFNLAARDFEVKGIHLHRHLPVEPLPAWADPRALHQVLLNLFTNACDALTGVADPQLILTAYRRDQLIWLIVRDNGCGMSDEQKKHLFQPFNTSKPNGNGLGLVITRKLLAMMDANIEIQSQAGDGTTVIITLPVPKSGLVSEEGSDS